jgi:hypothetical protein
VPDPHPALAVRRVERHDAIRSIDVVRIGDRGIPHERLDVAPAGIEEVIRKRPSLVRPGTHEEEAMLELRTPFRREAVAPSDPDERRGLAGEIVSPCAGEQRAGRGHDKDTERCAPRDRDHRIVAIVRAAVKARSR